MVSAFAEENGLETIVEPSWERNTPSRLLSGSAYHVRHGYILVSQSPAYLTWQGRMLENNSIVPKFSIELSRDALMERTRCPALNRSRGGEGIIVLACHVREGRSSDLSRVASLAGRSDASKAAPTKTAMLNRLPKDRPD